MIILYHNFNIHYTVIINIEVMVSKPKLKMTKELIRVKGPTKNLSLLNLIWNSMSDDQPLNPNLTTIYYDMFIELYRNTISTIYNMRPLSVFSSFAKLFPSFDPYISLPSTFIFWCYLWYPAIHKNIPLIHS